MSSSGETTRRALGKGINALLPQNRVAVPAQPSTLDHPHETASGKVDIAIGLIEPNPLQPRSVFEADRLSELAQSIRENGIIQPIVVRKVGEKYQLVAGERRWRAARIAGLERVPVVVQSIPDDRLMEITLIENIQREDLNPIEIAHGFDRLSREFGLSHEQIAQRTGKDRSTITNLLRLLKLPGDIQIMLAERRISMGHARALLALPAPEAQLHLAQRVSAEGLSVRQVERLVQKMTEPREPRPDSERQEDPNVKAAVLELERVLGTRVRIVPRTEERGKIEIEYFSQDDLSRIYETIVARG